MTVIENQLKITASEHVSNAFRAVAQETERLAQRVTKSQRVLVDAHKTAVQNMTEAATSGYATLERLAGLGGIAIGVDAVVEGAKKAVVEFANVDQQARALQVSTGASLANIKEFYEGIAKAATLASVPVAELRAAADTLARGFGVEGARAMLPAVAQAAAGMHANAQEAAAFNTQLIKTLGLAQKDVPEAFDSLIGAARGGGVQAAQLETGISQVARDMADIGMKGPKALHEVEAAMEAVGEVTKNSATAIEGVQTLINSINTKRFNEALLKQAGIVFQHQLEVGAKAGLSPLDVAVEQAHRAALIIQRRHPKMSLGEAYAELTKNPAIRQTLQELYAHKDLTAAARARIEASGGAMGEAAAIMTEGAAGGLQDFTNALAKATEAIGEFLVDKAPKGREPPNIGPLGWFYRRNVAPPGAPEEPPKPSPAPRAGTGRGGGYKPISGEMGDWGTLALIPSEPGSATERTAREQLEAIRRLERAAMWGGGALGGSSGPASGGGSPAGHGGGGSGATPGDSTPGGGGGSTPGASGHGPYNFQKAYDLIKQAGGTDEEARTLAAISQAESGGNPRAHNTRGRDNSYGLWQINMLGGMGPSRRSKFGLKSNEDLFNPATNARVALAMHRGARGYRDWTTYSSGAYKKYLGHARSAVAQKNAFHPIYGDVTDIDLGDRPPSTTPYDESDQEHIIGTSHTPSAAPFPHNPKFDDFARWTMTRGKRQPDEFITHPGISYGVDPRMPAIQDEPKNVAKEKSDYEKMQRYIDSNPLRMKVAFDTADVRTHSRAYARRSFNKEARDSRYASYTDMGTPA